MTSGHQNRSKKQGSQQWITPGLDGRSVNPQSANMTNVPDKFPVMRCVKVAVAFGIAAGLYFAYQSPKPNVVNKSVKSIKNSYEYIIK